VRLMWAHAAVGFPWFSQIHRRPAMICCAQAVFATVFGHAAHPHLKQRGDSRKASRSAVIHVPEIVCISWVVIAKMPRQT